jgi:hypothetical protein
MNLQALLTILSEDIEKFSNTYASKANSDANIQVIDSTAKAEALQLKSAISESNDEVTLKTILDFRSQYLAIIRRAQRTVPGWKLLWFIPWAADTTVSSEDVRESLCFYLEDFDAQLLKVIEKHDPQLGLYFKIYQQLDFLLLQFHRYTSSDSKIQTAITVCKTTIGMLVQNLSTALTTSQSLTGEPLDKQLYLIMNDLLVSAANLHNSDAEKAVLTAEQQTALDKTPFAELKRIREILGLETARQARKQSKQTDKSTNKELANLQLVSLIYIRRFAMQDFAMRGVLAATARFDDPNSISPALILSWFDYLATVENDVANIVGKSNTGLLTINQKLLAAARVQIPNPDDTPKLKDISSEKDLSEKAKKIATYELSWLSSAATITGWDAVIVLYRLKESIQKVNSSTQRGTFFAAVQNPNMIPVINIMILHIMLSPKKDWSELMKELMNPNHPNSPIPAAFKFENNDAWRLLFGALRLIATYVPPENNTQYLDRDAKADEKEPPNYIAKMMSTLCDLDGTYITPFAPELAATFAQMYKSPDLTYDQLSAALKSHYAATSASPTASK